MWLDSQILKYMSLQFYRILLTFLGLFTPHVGQFSLNRAMEYRNKETEKIKFVPCETFIIWITTIWLPVSSSFFLWRIRPSGLFSFRIYLELWILHRVGRTPWTGDQPVARLLPTQDNKNVPMPAVGFEPTILVFGEKKTFHALDRTANVVGPFFPLYENINCLGRLHGVGAQRQSDWQALHEGAVASSGTAETEVDALMWFCSLLQTWASSGWARPTATGGTALRTPTLRT
jgi:hypothetical protein